jgi:hypothetical protein
MAVKTYHIKIKTESGEILKSIKNSDIPYYPINILKTFEESIYKDKIALITIVTNCKRLFLYANGNYDFNSPDVVEKLTLTDFNEWWNEEDIVIENEQEELQQKIVFTPESNLLVDAPETEEFELSFVVEELKGYLGILINLVDDVLLDSKLEQLRITVIDELIFNYVMQNYPGTDYDTEFQDLLNALKQSEKIDLSKTKFWDYSKINDEYIIYFNEINRLFYGKSEIDEAEPENIFDKSTVLDIWTIADKVQDYIQESINLLNVFDNPMKKFNKFFELKTKLITIIKNYVTANFNFDFSEFQDLLDELKNRVQDEILYPDEYMQYFEKINKLSKQQSSNILNSLNKL